MTEGTAVAEPVERQNGKDKKNPVKSTGPGYGYTGRCYSRQGEKKMTCQGTYGDNGNKADQDESSAILVEKDVNQIMFFRMLSVVDHVIVNIMKMTVKNHFPRKGGVNNGTIHNQCC